MNACVIMYNMIIEDDRGKDLGYTFYELIGCPMRVQRREYMVAHFIHSYQTIRDFFFLNGQKLCHFIKKKRMDS
jgi:hypothetical protein